MRAVLDLLYPPACIACRAHGTGPLCATCREALPRLEAGCRRCAMPLSGAAGCRDCSRLQPAFSRTIAIARYDGVARDAMLAFKLGGHRRAAAALGAMMAPAARALGGTLLVPVPSTAASRAARGSDPAADLARAVARATGIPARPLLRKVRATADQAGLDVAGRRANQRGAYVAHAAWPGPVTLVDDIMTTGATADACARALLEPGTSDVRVLVFARTT